MKDRKYILFGANGGIGTAIAYRLKRRGARLWLAGRNEGALQKLANDLEAHVSVVDATDADALEKVIADAAQASGQLGGIVNCFGSILLKPAHLTSHKEWADTLAVNLTSCFAVTRAAARALSKDGGSVVFISTVAARTGIPNHEAIAAAKAGVIGLAQSAAATYAHKGIRFNVVAPGLIRTPLSERITSNEAALKASESMHPLGRIGDPDEVASAVEWFLDPVQSWVTGQVLGVDGGLSTLRSR